MPLTQPTAGYFKFYFGPRQFSYDLLGDLKDMIPSEDREYNPDSAEWTIAERWYSVMRELHDKYFKIPNYDLFGEE